MALSPAQRLVKYGFIKSAFKHYYKYDDKKGFYVIDLENKDPNRPLDYDGKHAEQEKSEEVNESTPFTKDIKSINPLTPTPYPKPQKRYRLVYESFGLSVEETYFWVLGHIRQDQANPEVDKIMDIFSASENSSYWGQANYRLGQQQEKITTYLATIGRMIKDLFQIVRELRVIDERLDVYTEWQKSKAADITLKSLFIELVERGTENRNSVYGLATQVGYATLPDLFFNTRVYKLEDIDAEVTKWEINENVKNVLRKKLFQFIAWRDRTEKELRSRRSFMIPYVRQHWGAIKMYMNWIKPYLKSVQRLSMSPTQIDSPDIISSFETSVTEIEILAKKSERDGYRPCVLAYFKFTTKPMLQFQQDSYQARGAVHVGRVEMYLRAYTWKNKEIEMYKKMKNDEDMELLGLIDDSVKAAMDALGDKLRQYLEEAGEKKIEDEPKKMKKAPSMGAGIFEPFIAVFSGLAEIITSLTGGLNFSSGPKESKGNPKSAKADALLTIWLVYKNYKKAHGLLSW